MNADIEDIIIPVNQFNSFLLTVTDPYFFQSPELADTMVDMDYIISGVQTRQLMDGHTFTPGELVIEPVPVIPVEDLVVGIEGDFQ